jgi:hypothetical protein
MCDYSVNYSYPEDLIDLIQDLFGLVIFSLIWPILLGIVCLIVIIITPYYLGRLISKLWRIK